MFACQKKKETKKNLWGVGKDHFIPIIKKGGGKNLAFDPSTL